ncbi:MAG TPA: helix-turn-helix transcriptional regulator [Terriglobales bacterium]|nr:helix-turn-helix transcriptional regulator [Terriglobales bacterium]
MKNQSETRRYSLLLRRLKTARQQAGLTQAAVARALRKPQSYVSKCESGERRVDAIELSAFANLYGRPVTFFIE